VPVGGHHFRSTATSGRDGQWSAFAVPSPDGAKLREIRVRPLPIRPVGTLTTYSREWPGLKAAGSPWPVAAWNTMVLELSQAAG